AELQALIEAIVELRRAVGTDGVLDTEALLVTRRRRGRPGLGEDLVDRVLGEMRVTVPGERAALEQLVRARGAGVEHAVGAARIAQYQIRGALVEGGKGEVHDRVAGDHLGAALGD